MTTPRKSPELSRATERSRTINMHLNSASILAASLTILGCIGQSVVAIDWFIIQYEDPAAAYVLAVVEALLMIMLIVAGTLSVLLNLIRRQRRYFMYALVSWLTLLAFSPVLPTLIRAVPSIGGTYRQTT